MKVLHLSAGNLYGGVERMLVTLAKHRASMPDLVPEFGLCFRGRLWDELTATGVPVHDLGAVRASRPWTVWKARRNAAALLPNFDVAIAHTNWPHAVFAPAAKRVRVPVVNWVHDGLRGWSWVDLWAARTRPSAVIANSRYTASTVANVFPGVRTEVIYCPTDLTPADPIAREWIRQSFGTSPETVVILQASRLERWKGAAVLVDALNRLKDEPNWECWLAGGPQKAGEHEFFAELKAAAGPVSDRVRFLGQRSDVASVMAAADIYCQPNTGPEPFGIAYVEALAAGLPVVSTAIGGALEIVDATCGVLVPPNDPAAVAEALRLLIRDPERRRTLGANGPKRAEALCEPRNQLELLQRELAR